MKSQKAITPLKNQIKPFNGNYTWWLNANKADYTTSGGVDYVDSIPLIGIVDNFEQPTAIQRPQYNIGGINSNNSFETTIQDQNIYKSIDSKIFDGDGTFAFIGLMNGSTLGQNSTFWTEAEANASAYNFQIYLPTTLGTLNFYTPADGIITVLNPFTSGVFSVHHFTINGTTLKYYHNGVLTTTSTVTQNMSTSRPLTAFGYKSLSGEQGIGEMGDVVALTGSSLTDSEVTDDYNNFWKKKYPILP